MMMDNIILIGPPGVGKSTVGVLLAKSMMMPFIDTDIIIQASEGRRLQDILDSTGVAAFIQLEERHILQLDAIGHVIATGGSAVYSAASMHHLRAKGRIVFLSLPCDMLLSRIHNLHTRGVVKPASQSFEEMYEERLGLYRRFANVEIDCAGMLHDEVVARIMESI